MSKRRLILGLTVVAFWAAMTTWLVRREGPTATLATTTLDGPTSSSMGIYLADGPRVGTLCWEQEPATRDGLPGTAWSARAALEMAVLGKATDLELVGTAWQAAAGDTATFRFDLRSGPDAARLEGELRDGHLRAEAFVGGERVSFDRPLEGRLIASAGFGAPLRLPGLEVGRSYRVASFDPLSLGLGTARLRCVARETRVVAGTEIETLVVELDAGGLAARAWVDAAGDVVRAETPVGLVFERVAEQGATEGPPAARAPAEWSARTAVTPTGRRPHRGARAMTLRIRGIDGRSVPTGARQTRDRDGTWHIVSGGPPDAASTIATPESSFETYLAAEAFVQRDHPEIRAAAAQAVGNAGDAWDKARRLNDWVFAAVEKDVALGLPSALEVLRHRRGDCNEHTVLYTALARAVGVPTRIAIGLVWSDELAGFYYHAWPEVWVGRWVAVDPTLGQAVADATHVKLLEGGIESWPRLLRFLGRIELEILEVE